MPELPEVETVIRSFKKAVINNKILDVKLSYAPLLKNVSFGVLKENILGKKISNVHRKGKNIIFNFNDCYLVSHLRMEGKFYLYEKKHYIRAIHDLFAFVFDDETILVYNDSRHFGTMHFYKKTEDNFESILHLQKLGPEPWDPDFNHDYLTKKLAKTNVKIKQFLLNQSNIAGIGNIYADEILFASKILPWRKTSSITSTDINMIIENTKRILEEAIRQNGTTVSSFASSYKKTGHFQNKLNVYGRKNHLCFNCNSKIEKIKQQGRGTHYCSKCQK